LVGSGTDLRELTSLLPERSQYGIERFGIGGGRPRGRGRQCAHPLRLSGAQISGQVLDLQGLLRQCQCIVVAQPQLAIDAHRLKREHDPPGHQADRDDAEQQLPHGVVGGTLRTVVGFGVGHRGSAEATPRAWPAIL
jgi:hypothetical protein